MAFKDEVLRCAACGKTFVYTVREQRARIEQGLSKEPPVFCADCRGGDVRLRGAEVPPAAERPERRSTGYEPRSSREGDARSPESRSLGPNDYAGRRPAAPPDLRGREQAGSWRQDSARPENLRPGGGRPETGRSDRRPGGYGRGDARPGGRQAGGGARFGGRSGGGGQVRGGRSGTGGRGGPGGARRGGEQTRQQELRIRYTGVVKWFDDARGFGFIAQEEGDEVFVHTSGIIVENVTTLREGQPVEYEVERTMRGLQAVDVIPLAW